jgi:hypothetical protein
MPYLAIISNGLVRRRRFASLEDALTWLDRETLGEPRQRRHFRPVYDYWWTSARCRELSKYRWEIFPTAEPAPAG